MKNKLFTLVLLTTLSIFYSCQKEPTASFTVSSTSVNIGETVTFTNTSKDANSCLWDFGDGETSITESPSHIYDSTGTFTVTLTAFSKDVNKKDIATEIIKINLSITTLSVTFITPNSALCGGNVKEGTTVTSRGVCWNKTGNPTISDNHTTDGSGIGTFTSRIYGLTPFTTYYIRAFATNTTETFYGPLMNFTTTNGTCEGGIVFYIDDTGQHGLVAATSDQSTGTWGCYETTIGGTSDAVGTGQTNTTAILNKCNEAGIAARICDDLILNGYSDWFLPSKNELELIHQNLYLRGIGDFAYSDNYWSSTEQSSKFGWIQQFFHGVSGVDGVWCGGNKGNIERIRAVRAF